MDGCIKFALLTGVTKFGKMSVFSDLNNLEDISMSLEYSDICGITEKEMLANFDGHIGQLALNNDMTKDEAVAKLREQYDGHHSRLTTSSGTWKPATRRSSSGVCVRYSPTLLTR